MLPTANRIVRREFPRLEPVPCCHHHADSFVSFNQEARREKREKVRYKFKTLNKCFLGTCRRSLIEID
jgi:hypothetical protein